MLKVTHLYYWSQRKNGGSPTHDPLHSTNKHFPLDHVGCTADDTNSEIYVSRNRKWFSKLGTVF